MRVVHTEKYFPVMLCLLLYKVVLTSESVDKILRVIIQMKATEQYFPVVCLLCCTAWFYLLSLWTKS